MRDTWDMGQQGLRSLWTASLATEGLRTVTGRQRHTVGRPAPRVQPTRGGADFSGELCEQRICTLRALRSVLC